MVPGLPCAAHPTTALTPPPPPLTLTPPVERVLTKEEAVNAAGAWPPSAEGQTPVLPELSGTRGSADGTQAGPRHTTSAFVS